MSKIAFTLTIVLPVAIALPIDVGLARTGDFKVANANDFPNSGICPNGHRVKDLKNCQAQKPKH
jgi:hypothetical protein